MNKHELLLMPISIREANEFVANFHRHNRRVSAGKWAVAVGIENTGLVGVAIVGNPVSATLMDGWTAEVLRVCIHPEAPKNVGSMLYSACWRAWRAMGGRRLVTYTLQSEAGISLRAANWKIIAECRPGTWNRPNQGRLRDWQPIYGQFKFRWEPS